MTQEQEFESFDILQPIEFADLILGKVKSSQKSEVLKPSDSWDIIVGQK